MAPSISVILPAWNREESIRAAAESVLRQTFADFELLIVDDCSTDGTAKAIAAIEDPRVRCLSTLQNKGPSGARNQGIAQARGTWIAFQDSDDEWLPEKLARQMARIEVRGGTDVGAYCGMVITGSPEDDGTSARTTAIYHPPTHLQPVEGDISQMLLRHSLISTQTLMVRRDALQDAGGFDETLPALVDWECVIRLSLRGSFAFVDSPLVIQNFSANSVTRDRLRRTEAREEILKKHHDLLAAHPDILAQHWRSVAGDARRLGQISRARAALARARALRPLDPALVGLSALLSLKSDKNV